MINIDTMDLVVLGREGENLSAEIEIDVRPWLERWPEGTVALLHLRSGEETPYVVQTTLTDGILHWPVTAADTAVAGKYGRAEVRLTCGGVVKKSTTLTTLVYPALPGTALPDPPSAAQSWVDAVTEAAAAAEDAADSAQLAADAAENAAETAETAAQNAQNSVVNLHAAVTSVAGGARITVTDQNGSVTTYDVLNPCINDAQAASDAPWSGAKTEAELAEKLDAQWPAEQAGQWLTIDAEGMVESQPLPVDASLSVAGCPADAAAAGERLRALLGLTCETEEVVALPVTGSGPALVTQSGAFTGTQNVLSLLDLRREDYTVNGLSVSWQDNRVTIAGTAAAGGYLDLHDGVLYAARGYVTGAAGTLPAGRYQFRVKAVSGPVGSFLLQSAGVSAYCASVSANALYANFTLEGLSPHLLFSVSAGTVYDREVAVGLFPFTVAAETAKYMAQASAVTTLRPGIRALGPYTWGGGEVRRIAMPAGWKRAAVQWRSGEDAGQAAAEQLIIDLPRENGFARFTLLHTQDAAKNADCWRLGKLFACDDFGQVTQTLAINGEWEAALHLKNRTDFSGGYAHGNEMQEGSLVVYLDGQPAALAALTARTAFRTLRVMESTALYDPDDPETVIARQNRVYCFDRERLVLRQRITWQCDEEITSCYVGMLPAARMENQLVQSEFGEPVILDAAVNTFVHGARQLTVFVPGAALTMRVLQHPWAEPLLYLCDNGGLPYCKLYAVARLSGAVSDGEAWCSEVAYEVDM